MYRLPKSTQNSSNVGSRFDSAFSFSSLGTKINGSGHKHQRIKRSKKASTCEPFDFLCNAEIIIPSLLAPYK